MTLDQFVKACEESGVEQVVMRRTSEMRPITDDDGTTVGPVQRVVLLGYGRGELIRHERPGTGVDCMAALTGAGLRVKLSQDHIIRREI